MVLVTVLRRFRDFASNCDRIAGEQFEATEKRAEYIDAKLPGYITFVPVTEESEPEASEEADLAKLTVAALKALAAERGIDIPKGTKKAQLIALLEE
jgi:hypothetical protein